MPKTAHYSPFTTHRPGARLYHSTASVWLSVDPLSDKYPSVSPYVYCANNPVRLVDPDGREIWEIDECGKVVKTYENNEFDQICVVNNDGITIAESSKYTAHTFSLIAEEGVTLFVSDNNDAAKDMFFFISDHTDVETEHYATNTGSFIGTSQDTYSSATVSTASDQTGFTMIDEHTHSHPHGVGVPSKKDYNIACNNPNTDFYIYVPKNGISKYDKYTPYLENGKMNYFPLLNK